MAGKNPRVPVDVVARTGKFTKGVKGAAAAGTAAFTTMAAASVAAIAGITKATVGLSAEINQIAKDAKRTGLGIEEFQKLDGAIGLLTDGTVKVTDALQEYQKRTGEARPDMVALAEEFAGMDDAAQATARGMELFGSRYGKVLAGALREGGPAWEAAIADIEAAGVVSAEAAFQAEVLQDKIALSSQEFLAMRTDALVPIMPVIRGVIDGLMDLSAELRETGALTRFGETAATVFLEVVLPAITVGVGESVKALRGLFVTLTALQGGLQQASVMGQAFVITLENILPGVEVSEEKVQRLADSFEEMQETRSRLDKLTAGFTGTEEEYAAVMDVVAGAIRRAKDADDDLSRSRSRGGGADGPPAGGEPDPEGSGKVAARSDNLNAIKELEAQAAAELAELAAEGVEVNRAAEEAKRAEVEHTRQTRLDAAAVSLMVATDTLNAIGNLSSAITDLRVANIDRESEEYKQAMREQWAIQSALAIANAAIAIPLAISQQLAGTPGPVGIALSVVAGVIASANLAATIAKAAAGPTFHTGGDVASRLGPSAGSPDEINATLLRGERVQSRAEVRSGRSQGPITTVIQVGPRTVDAFTTEALRTGQGALYEATRTKRIGRHDPYRRSR